MKKQTLTPTAAQIKADETIGHLLDLHENIDGYIRNQMADIEDLQWSADNASNSAERVEFTEYVAIKKSNLDMWSACRQDDVDDLNDRLDMYTAIADSK